jgi:hypothetical protein
MQLIVIKTSERFIRETQARVPDACGVNLVSEASLGGGGQEGPSRQAQPGSQLTPEQNVQMGGCFWRVSLSREEQFAQEGANKDWLLFNGRPGTQVIKIVQLAAHGGLPFEVDVWRDVDCARSLISADWAAAFGAVADAYPYPPPGHPRFSASPVVMRACGDILDCSGASQ